MIQSKGERMCDNNVFKAKCKKWVNEQEEQIAAKLEYIEETPGVIKKRAIIEMIRKI